MINTEQREHWNSDDGRHSETVLITGCSTGIGRATALRLAHRGWPVVATARRPETLAALADAGCRTRRLDVCDESSMLAVVDEIEATDGAVGVLVNNAGYGLEGPVEELALDDVRRQFETNLFGPLRLVQLVLPGMRGRQWGKIVNVGSVAGRISLPGGAAYHASKHALEALSDALRFEVRGFGIEVVVIEPGAIRSHWVETAISTLASRNDETSPYDVLRDATVARLRGAHAGLLRFGAGGPERVARVIEHAIDAPHPRARYVVPAVAHTITGVRRVLPDFMWDAFLRRMYPTPGTSPRVNEGGG